MTSAIHPQQFHPHSHSTPIRVASGLNFLAAIYLIISAWMRDVGGGATPNAIIFGIIVAILAASRFSGARPWAAWIDALIGIWMIISPWIYGYAGGGWMWNSIIVGVIMLVLGVWSATAKDFTDTTARE
ncbi:MAG TPA: SPW repeat protein [Gemmatimonadaceae bacterium]|nr:SPW repeat protein [Gemmatimonadaceae bacterium]